MVRALLELYSAYVITVKEYPRNNHRNAPVVIAGAFLWASRPISRVLYLRIII